MVKKHKEAIIP